MVAAPATGSRTTGSRGRVLVLATEDWFVVSHFIPVLRALKKLGAEVAVATRLRDKSEAIAAAGARPIDFDFRRGLLQPGHDAMTLLRLIRLLRQERPDVVHAIALKPIAAACLASLCVEVPALVMHLTGVGYAGTVAAGPSRHAYRAALRLIARGLRRPGRQLLVENREDAARVRECGAFGEDRVTLLAGAGVDADRFRPGPGPDPTPKRAGFVGRMIWSKGVDVLVAAQQLLRTRGVDLELWLAGAPDAENPRAVPVQTLELWSRLPGISWRARVADVPAFWRETPIAVVPSRGGEGLPRALLEAAACGRPAIVSDVAGCRAFVRHEVEGLIVPPENPEALAAALERLVDDPALAARLGAAGRDRVLTGFTEAHVEAQIERTYRQMLAREALPPAV